jgi:hypothetical protein
MAAEIWENENLKTQAPDVVKALNGRKIGDLEPHERLDIFKLYVAPKPGKVRTWAAVTMGTLLLQNASPELMQKLAELIKNRDQIEPSQFAQAE